MQHVPRGLLATFQRTEASAELRWLSAASHRLAPVYFLAQAIMEFTLPTAALMVPHTGERAP